jgi:AraC family transcriptional regulator of arabinose operon
MVFGHFRRDKSYYAWRPGGAEDWLLILTVAGGGRIRFGKNETALPRGTAMLIRPGTVQDYFTDPAPGRWELLWAHFVPPSHWPDLLDWPEIYPGIGLLTAQQSAVRSGAIGALRRAVLFSHRHWPTRESFSANALHETLLWLDLENPRSSNVSLDSRVRRALDFMTSDPRRPLRLNQVARAAALSPSRLSELFSAQVGMSPRRYWERHRLERARELLSRTQSSVAEVATAVGFPDPFYFSTRFRRVMGKSPRAFRDELLRKRSS